jgi:hypothetical protein
VSGLSCGHAYTLSPTRRAFHRDNFAKPRKTRSIYINMYDILPIMDLRKLKLATISYLGEAPAKAKPILIESRNSVSQKNAKRFVFSGLRTLEGKTPGWDLLSFLEVIETDYFEALESRMTRIPFRGRNVIDASGVT